MKPQSTLRQIQQPNPAQPNRARAVSSPPWLLFSGKLLLLTVLTLFITTLQAQVSHLVISQVYGGAGCGTIGCSSYKNDFIEIYNPTGNTQSLTGWSVQYSSSTGTTTWQTTPLSGSIQSGQYFLISEAGNSNGNTSLPAADVTGSISMSATAGRVALVNSTTALVGCSSSSSIVDLVAYGTGATCFEGSTGPAPAPSTSNSIFRKSSGCTDANNNATDFDAATPSPRNSSSAFNFCPSAPSITATGTSSVSNNSATLTGTVNPNNASTTVVFEYGLTNSYGSTIAATQSPLSGNTAQSVSATLSSLSENTKYYFRIKATNSVNTTNGSENNFTTCRTWYADADNDGFGNPAVSQVSCSQPLGYVTDNTDCNDGNAGMHSSFSFYTDADGDGYGIGNLVLVCAVDANTPPTGYATNNTDCNDNNSSAHASYDFYTDNDNDGYGTGNAVSLCAVDANTPPTGYATNNTDCNDNNSSAHASYDFYVDNDNDGYGTGNAVSLCAVDANTPPAGYATNNTDCNDNSSSVHASFNFYVDNDNDGFGAGRLIAVCAVDANTPPSGYSLDNTDCDDSNNSIHQSFSFYTDNDHDGYGTGNLQSVCAVDANTPPAGYSLDNTDCDDNNSAAHATFSFYHDFDNDGYGAGRLTAVCAADANTPPAGYSTNNTDCDDNNSSAHQTFSFYVDDDGDGYGAGSLQQACAVDANTPPAGFSLDGSDCDDGNSNIHQKFSFYADNDGDGYGAGTAVLVCAADANSAPAGYSLSSSDCDDNDNILHQTFSFYADNDHDGFGAGSLVPACAVDGNSPPTGYSLDNTDCDDANSSIHETFNFYADNDNDGYGAGTSVPVCAVDANTPPSGYSLSNSDCDDTNGSIHQSITFYADTDNDGYGDPSNTTSACSTTPPTGFVSNSDDCNDGNSAIHPGATEICDGIDNDCDGLFDEGADPSITGVLPAANPICGHTKTAITASGVSFNSSTTGTITWYTQPNGGGSNLGMGNTISVYPGTYYARVTNGCGAAEATVTVAKYLNPTLRPIVTNITCYGAKDGSIVLNATGGSSPYTFKLAPISYYGPTNSFTIRKPGDFTAYVRDINGCVDSKSVTITEPTEIKANVKVFPPTCRHSNGSFSLKVSGGTSPYSYKLAKDVTYTSSATFSNLVAKDYWVNIKDAAGCVITKKVTLPSGCTTFERPGLETGVGESMEGIEVVLSPNPSAVRFMLKVLTSTEEPISVKVTDAVGRIVYKTTATANQSTSFGEQLTPGIYLVEVKQGKEVRIVKAVKLK